MKTHIDYTFEGLNMTPAGSLADAVKLYGMDFTAEKREIRFPDKHGKFILVAPRDEMVVNKSTDRPIGVVGIGYTLVQHPDAYDVCEPLITAGSSIVGGGCPNNGERAYMVLEAQQRLVLSPGDEIVNRYLILNSHDGTGKIQVRCTPYRAYSGIAFTTNATHPLSFKHTRKVHQRVANVKRIFRNINQNWELFQTGARKMMGIHMTPDQAREFVAAVLPAEGEANEKYLTRPVKNEDVSKRLENIRADILDVYWNKGIGTRMPQCRGTLFGLVEAFAEWADIDRTVRKSKVRDDVAAALDTRLVSDSAKKKAKAWGMALALIKIGERTKGAFGNAA